MRFNVFVRFKNTSDQFCLWPIMQEHSTKRCYIGGLIERYPTEYSKRTVGTAIAFALKNQQVAQVEVKEAPPDYDSGENEEGGYLNSCPGDVGARDSF